MPRVLLHKFHREPDEDDKNEHLHDQREIDIHNRLLTSTTGRTFSASART